MTPYEQVEKLYRDHPQTETFEWYVDWYMKNAFLFSTREFFVMGRPVLKDALCWRQPANADCWYIHAMAGDLRRVWSILPLQLPWIAFERLRGGGLDLQIMPLERLRRLATDQNDPPILAEA